MSNEYKDWRIEDWNNMLNTIKPLSDKFINELCPIKDGSTPLNHNTIWNVDKWCASHQYMLIGFGKIKDQLVYIIFDIPLCETVYGPCTEEWLDKLRNSIPK